MLFTLANKQVEFLIKSDFNSLTCLLIGKLFDHCMTDKVIIEHLIYNDLVMIIFHVDEAGRREKRKD